MNEVSSGLQFESVLEASGILEFVDELSPKVVRALQLATNATARRSRTMLSRKVRSEVNFTTGYLNSNDRLKVTQFASEDKIEARVRGRDRATSLARFATKTSSNRRGGGVTVRVKPGVAVKMKRAFLVNLRNGNQGLAIRLPSGQQPRAAYKPMKLGNGAWLLYGPSVQQALRHALSDAGSIRDVLPDVDAYYRKEFARLMKLELD